MKNIALIIAGGSGHRMKQEIPKQFLHVNDKPVIIYTLEAFQNHPNIDEIGVVCIEGWHNMLEAYARQYHITKLKWIVNGGDCGQSSIRNGIEKCSELYEEDSLILAHDAIRPMVSPEIISDCIVQCNKYGSAISALPCNTVALKKTTLEYSSEVDPRDTIALTQTPQAFPLKKLAWAHKEALNRGITNAVASCSMMIDLGEKVYFSLGAETNIKLTTPEDLKIFKALLNMER